VREAGERQCCNMPIQAACQGIIKLAMARLWRERELRPYWNDIVRFIMQIHDSLIVTVLDDPTFAKTVASWMYRAMTTSVKLKVPVDADFKWGLSWGDTEKLKLEVAK
jgi:DNA polymerase I-like protein with 3'-5' exonuclease and polymerase domains